MSKAWKITIIVVSSILVLIFGFISVYYLWPWNKNFFDVSTKEFVIPGLDTHFVPQGFSRIDDSEDYIISGYMSNGDPSRLYIVDKDGNVKKFITLMYAGADYTGHAGGVASRGSSVWVVGDSMCHRIMLADINNAENSAKIKVFDSFHADNIASYVFIHNNILWIGEFFTEKDYETDVSHRMTTRSGEQNQSLIFGYSIDESRDYGLYSSTPSKAISSGREIQGIAVTSSGEFIVSSSYSIKDSTLYRYSAILNEEKHASIIKDKKSIDLWYLDNKSLIAEMKIPSMSEEIIIKNDKVYILFESSAKKYKLFNRKQLKNVYSIAIDSIK